MGKNSQPSDISGQQLSSIASRLGSASGAQASMPQALGIGVPMGSVPSYNSQWNKQNAWNGGNMTPVNLGDDMRFPGQDVTNGGNMGPPPSWRQPVQQTPIDQGSSGTGASAALNALNGTTAGNPYAPSQPPPPPQWGQGGAGYAMWGGGGRKRRQMMTPYAQTNSGGITVAIPQPQTMPGVGNP